MIDEAQYKRMQEGQDGYINVDGVGCFRPPYYRSNLFTVKEDVYDQDYDFEQDGYLDDTYGLVLWDGASAIRFNEHELKFCEYCWIKLNAAVCQYRYGWHPARILEY